MDICKKLCTLPQTLPPPFSVSLSHTVNWVVSLLYFLLWVAVQSLRNIVLRLYSSIRGHQTSIMGFTVSLLEIQTLRPHPDPLNQNLHFSTIPMGFMHTRKYENLYTKPPVLFLYLSYFYGYFFLAGSHLSTLTFVLAPSRLFIFSEVER